MSAASGYVLLEDGTRLEGDLCGAPELVTGEVVFNTAMTGYQESVTDPSYAGQIITFTYPLIGNYGVSAEAMESDRVHARAVIMREGKNGEDAATAEGGWLDWLTQLRDPGDHRRRHARARPPHPRPGRDARRHLQRRGPGDEARERIAAEPQMAGADLARTVTPARAVVARRRRPAHRRHRHRDQALDRPPVRASAAARLTLLPCGSSPADVLARDPDLVFLANGPGDPAALDYVVDTVRELIGKKPVFGICLGHQLLCRAVGLETFKLPFGHRGANHPVKELEHRQDRDHLAEPRLRRRRTRRRGADRGRRAGPLGDRLRRRRALPPEPLRPHGRGPRPARRRPAAPSSTTPRPAPGPHDARHLFDRFLELAQ